MCVLYAATGIWAVFDAGGISSAWSVRFFYFIYSKGGIVIILTVYLIFHIVFIDSTFMYKLPSSALMLFARQQAGHLACK